jgi:hypothetical protein
VAEASEEGFGSKWAVVPVIVVVVYIECFIYVQKLLTF